MFVAVLILLIFLDQLSTADYIPERWGTNLIWCEPTRSTFFSETVSQGGELFWLHEPDPYQDLPQGPTLTDGRGRPPIKIPFVLILKEAERGLQKAFY